MISLGQLSRNNPSSATSSAVVLVDWTIDFDISNLANSGRLILYDDRPKGQCLPVGSSYLLFVLMVKRHQISKGTIIMDSLIESGSIRKRDGSFPLDGSIETEVSCEMCFLDENYLKDILELRIRLREIFLHLKFFTGRKKEISAIFFALIVP